MTLKERMKRHTALGVRESGALGFLRRASAKRIHLFPLIPPFADLIDRLRQRGNDRVGSGAAKALLRLARVARKSPYSGQNFDFRQMQADSLA